jgi:class 3 adenylate cyclase
MAAAALFGLYKWRIRKLVQEKEQLEVTVAERTVEIRQQRDQIQVEQERSEALLLNILPGSVATELKETGSVQPHNFDEVTVCFTDFVGFTLSSQEMQAEELVSSLHEYFTYFDELTGEYGLEKLKTIGDSYMLVSGLPHARRGHAVNAVLGALRMVDVVEELAHRGNGAAWGVRVGLNSGPVAAGVVGVRKFAYDIWGNTVNMASRMESSGAPGRVNLSRSTYELVKDFVECHPRGQVKTKDKQDLEMFFAVGVHPRLDTPEKFAELYRSRFGEDPVIIPKMRVAAQAR